MPGAAFTHLRQRTPWRFSRTPCCFAPGFQKPLHKPWKSKSEIYQVDYFWSREFESSQIGDYSFNSRLDFQGK